jgi:hypothetical protein
MRPSPRGRLLRGVAVLYYTIVPPKSIKEAPQFVKRITNFLITLSAFDEPELQPGQDSSGNNGYRNKTRVWRVRHSGYEIQ